MNTKRTVLVGSSGHESADFLEFLTRTVVLDPSEKGLRRKLGARLVLCAVLLGGHVWVRMQAQELGYEGEALGRIIHRLDQERMELEMATARESSTGLLTSRGARELGMQKAAQGQIRRIDAQP